jgi:PAS domain S-box-containing protein
MTDKSMSKLSSRTYLLGSLLTSAICWRSINRSSNRCTVMSQRQVEALGKIKCRVCDVTMRLFGIEAHPDIDHADLRTYVCPRCDAVETETMPAAGACAVLQNLSDEIKLCYERAAEAKERADQALDPEAKADFLNIERRWLLLARSYEFGERLDDFTRENTRRAKPVPTIVPQVSHRQAPVNILIVDDEPKNLTVLEAILDEPDYRLVRADSAEQALLALLADEFALLILDIRMPSITGLELAQTIKARKKNAHVPIIFLTAYYGEDHHIVEGYGSGAVDYVTKPVNPGILRSKVGAFAEIYRKQRSLEDANRILAAVVDSSDDAIISKDLDGIIATFNQGAERLFGYKAVEVVGKPITILIPPDRQHEEPEILARIRRGERVDHYETVRRRKDGTLVDISLTVSPVKDDQGRVIGASKIARDITERKLTDAKLRDSERQLQDLITAIPAAIYTTDAQGKITYFNQATVELAGRTPTVGSDEWRDMWKFYRPDGTPLPHDQYPIAIALKEGRAIRNAEVVLERPDGTRVPIIPYPTPLHDGAGKLVGAINMLVDVSERKQAETQQRILFNELNHRVKNNMQMLQILLEAGAQRAKSAEAREVLDEASSRIMAMATAQRVLYTTHDATRFNAQDFLTTICETAKQTFPEDVEIDCEADAVQLPNDAAMPLALIANELLTNAVKYGLSGRGDGTIRVRLRRESDSFLFYVEDDGPGFDLQSVQRRSSGLALVQGLVRQLGGTFEVSIPPTRCSVRF